MTPTLPHVSALGIEDVVIETAPVARAAVPHVSALTMDEGLTDAAPRCT
jgi:hypothetical protein